MADDKLPEISGVDRVYETLYSGSKHFWKARCHVEFTVMWHHSPVKFIEIAAFNVDLHEESERIFADPELLFSTVDREEVEAKVRTKVEDMMRQRKPRVPSEELAKAIIAQMAVQMVIQRAIIDPKIPAGTTFRIIVHPQTGDELKTEDKSLMHWIIDRPEGFVDTDIPRKKKATKTEFKTTLLQLKADSKKLTMECNKAARKAGLAKSACEGFMTNKARYTYDPERMSAAKIRFLKAGRRIIALNCVRKVTALLDRLERQSMGDYPISPVAGANKKELDMFPSIMTPSPSMDSMSIPGGRRASRPHHRLRPVRRATKPAPSSEYTPTEIMGTSQSTPLLAVP